MKGLSFAQVCWITARVLGPATLNGDNDTVYVGV